MKGSIRTGDQFQTFRVLGDRPFHEVKNSIVTFSEQDDSIGVFIKIQDEI